MGAVTLGPPPDGLAPLPHPHLLRHAERHVGPAPARALVGQEAREHVGAGPSCGWRRR
jgi:hypothetical protein